MARIITMVFVVALLTAVAPTYLLADPTETQKQLYYDR